jgi:hypothetical protein
MNTAIHQSQIDSFIKQAPRALGYSMVIRSRKFLAGPSWDQVGLHEALAADQAQPHAAVGGIEPLTDALGVSAGKSNRTQSSIPFRLRARTANDG